MRLETCIRKSLRLKAHRVREVREEEGRLVAEVERIGGRWLRCGRCGLPSRTVHSRQREREWRDLTVREQVLVLHYAPVRVVCRGCGVKVERVPWAAPWQRITRALSLALARLARELSWKRVAAHYGVDWKTVLAAVRSAVVRGLAQRRWKALHVIGIDEVSRSKGHRYLTLVYDLERRRLVWVGENRDAETMVRFFTWLGQRRANGIQVVCCDMWAPYLGAIESYLPQAKVVFDRFHVVQHLNRALDDVRRRTWRRLPDAQKSAFKRTRWLWLKNPWNLEPGERRRLSALCRRNMPIVRAYLLKEGFQGFWEHRHPIDAALYLRHWLRAAKRSRLEPFNRFARMIEAHLEGLLTWTALRVSNGALEGMNNRIKLVSHRAFGFRRPTTYITAIWHSCGGLPLN